MTEPRRFQKGTRIYTKWGNTKEVKVMSHTSNENAKDNPIPIQFELEDNLACGIYSNLASITHSKDEFNFDFAFLLPRQNKAKIRSRIITSPAHAKRFLQALQENIKKYEENFRGVT